MISKLRTPLFLGALLLSALLPASDLRAQYDEGYRMWLRYVEVTDPARLQEYRTQFTHVVAPSGTETADATRREIEMGLEGLLGAAVPFRDAPSGDGALIVGTPATSTVVNALGVADQLGAVGPEGFIIQLRTVNGARSTVVAANSEIGVLYGVFHLLREMQTHTPAAEFAVVSAPRVKLRMANHWDNLVRTVERGYAGISLWDWATLPEWKDPRYADYARFNASLGINGAAINNVNADANILRPYYLEKVAALADSFRPYGVKVFLSINFFAPMSVGGLDTADPVDPRVRDWWKAKVDEIYTYIPDFGGFLVKADSEGQPGPQRYGRDHATGANMFAEALAPHGGVVMWRAFVYDPSQADRFREAYDEFVPLDGQFLDNVIVQVKNGPIDFQPREPFSPLFGALPETNTMIELQVTQEYYGFATNLAYQGTLFEEVLDADTHARGEGSTVGRVVAGEVFDYTLTGMAAVINPGTAANWTGHPFVQSSWYAFGRLAWDFTLSAEEIAEEWARMTFSNDPTVVEPVKEIMMISREAGVNFRSPLGLAHLPSQGDHYGPAPWTAGLARADWTAVYYHRADADGIGFDRTPTGSNAVEQYFEPVRRVFSDISLTPDDYLLWFHRVGWDHPMKSGRTLWNELVHRYYEGVEQVRDMRRSWDTLEGKIDDHRFQHVKALLEVQEGHAIWWRDSCVLYFQSFSGRPIPPEYEQPEHDLEYYRNLQLYIPRY